MADPLFAIRNAFYVGAYNTVVNEASSLTGLSERDAIERDAFVYRSYIALGSYELVLSEISESAATGLLAIRLLAQYKAGRASKDSVFATLADWLADSACNRNPIVLLVAGILYLADGKPGDALKACAPAAGDNLELQALCVQAYVRLDRPDKAEAAVRVMAGVDDDATLTQLATAWVGLALGGAKVAEAAVIFQELGDKFGWTPALHVGHAAAAMKVGEWEDAERDLLDATARDAKDPDTLANLVTAGLHLGKPVTRYLAQLRIVAPSHPLVSRADAAEEAFQRAAAAMV